MGKDDGGGGGEQAVKEGTREGIAEQRRQFDIIQKLFKPFLEAGTGALPDFIRGSSLEGLSENLSKIFDTDIFKDVVGESRNLLESGASALGLSRSGGFFKDLSQIPLAAGRDIEGDIFSRISNLVGLGAGTATQQAQAGLQTGSNISSLFQAQGSQLAQLSNARANRSAAATQGLLNAGASITSAAILASDPRLKINVEHISDMGNLKQYQWDWHPAIADTFISKFPTIGFLADEVEEKYPEFVVELAGIKCIYYGDLLDALEKKYGPS